MMMFQQQRRGGARLDIPQHLESKAFDLWRETVELVATKHVEVI